MGSVELKDGVEKMEEGRRVEGFCWWCRCCSVDVAAILWLVKKVNTMDAA